VEAKQQQTAIAYEKPEVQDFGSLRELTEGGTVRGLTDALWPTKGRKGEYTNFS
jgi:hypothetical protein